MVHLLDARGRKLVNMLFESVFKKEWLNHAYTLAFRGEVYLVVRKFGQVLLL